MRRHGRAELDKRAKNIKRLGTVYKFQAVAQLPRAINAPALVEHLAEVKVGNQVWLVVSCGGRWLWQNTRTGPTQTVNVSFLSQKLKEAQK